MHGSALVASQHGDSPGTRTEGVASQRQQGPGAIEGAEHDLGPAVPVEVTDRRGGAGGTEGHQGPIPCGTILRQEPPGQQVDVAVGIDIGGQQPPARRHRGFLPAPTARRG